MQVKAASGTGATPDTAAVQTAACAATEIAAALEKGLANRKSQKK